MRIDGFLVDGVDAVPILMTFDLNHFCARSTNVTAQRSKGRENTEKHNHID